MSGKRIVDAALTALLLCLMAYKVTGRRCMSGWASP